MATATYTPIATTTSSGSSSTISFTSIPSTYTDLRIILNGVVRNNLLMTFNGVTANYSDVEYYGDGSTAYSSQHTNRANIVASYVSTTGQSEHLIDVFNYTSSQYKTCLIRFSDASYGTGATIGVGQYTSAINQIDLISNGANFSSGTTATLYGIKAA
jgi:hypothetical protein